jgi:thiol-disulfide isomerase/thioredoxin
MNNLIYRLLFVAWIFCSLIGCEKNEFLDQTPTSNTQIVGRISDYNPSIHDYTVTLLLPNIITDDSDVALAFLDSLNHTFEFNFHLESPQIIIARYAGENFHVYVNPGDSININIEAGREYPSDPEFNVVNPGLNHVNLYLDPWVRQYRSTMREIPLPVIGQTDFAYYLQAVQQVKLKAEEALMEFMTMNSIDNRQFKRLAKEMIEFGYAGRLVIYKVRSDNYYRRSEQEELKAASPDLEMGRQLSVFIDSLNLDDKQFIENNFFHYFFNSFDAYVFYQVRDVYNTKYDDFTEENFNQTYLRYVNENYKSQALDLLLSRYLYKKIGAYEIQRRPEILAQFSQLLDSSKNKISNANRSFLEAEFEKVRNENEGDIIGQIQVVEHSDQGVEFWDKVLESYDGKVVYIKFWAPWCGPCMSNWKSAENLAKSYAGEELKVLAVCIDTGQQKWNESISGLTSAVDHVYLDRDQSNIVKTQFDITSIPRNLIIGGDGKVFHSNAPESGSKDGTLNRFLQDILEQAM